MISSIIVCANILRVLNLVYVIERLRLKINCLRDILHFCTRLTVRTLTLNSDAIIVFGILFVI
jgi:hypothetical protein